MKIFGSSLSSPYTTLHTQSKYPIYSKRYGTMSNITDSNIYIWSHGSPTRISYSDSLCLMWLKPSFVNINMKHFYIKLKILIFYLLHYISTAVWRENDFFISLSFCLLLLLFILQNWWRCFGSLPCVIRLRKIWHITFMETRWGKWPQSQTDSALLLYRTWCFRVW